MGDNLRPIIIKKKKVSGGGGHHGGAWKVAYADFVTAMMAFFMLMWLLNATTDKQRRGLADYFSPVTPVSSESSGGSGALGGETLTADAVRILAGRGGVTDTAKHGNSEEEASLKAAEDAILGKGGESLLEQEELRHVSVRLTDEGLVIELFDLPGAPLFRGAEPTPLLQRILASVAPELHSLPNGLALSAFTASAPLVVRRPGLWALSTDRARALRDALPAAGIAQDRVRRLSGHADRRPASRDPLSVRNERVEIVVLRSGTEWP
ncbi:MAG: flagellar motor protein MotB [Pseudomonadota bacterium]